jgi:hypothetical protein
MARKSFSQPRPFAVPRAPVSSPVRHDDMRPGRVGGAAVAFGAPGPSIDLARVLETWRDGTTVTSGMAAAPTRDPPMHDTAAHDAAAHAPTAPPHRTVALSDGTQISFTVAGALLTLQDQ